jgi:hypothetical protein
VTTPTVSEAPAQPATPPAAEEPAVTTPPSTGEATPVPQPAPEVAHVEVNGGNAAPSTPVVSSP